METRKLTRLSLFISTGVILFVVESFFPTPFPWIKLGIANTVTLIALYYYGVKEAIIVAILRIIIGSLIKGVLFNPLFIISISAGTGAAVMMSFTYRYFGNKFSVIGISIWGALIFNVVQIIVANLLFVKKGEIYYLLPAGII
ncbi:heptaprenyl diphosphate synthase, partial [candidate division KSB1 bacterium]